MRKAWNEETSEWEYYPDEIETQEAAQVREVVQPRAERVEAIRAIVEQKTAGSGMSNAERQRKWRENHPGQYAKRRQYHLDYMKEYRARQK